MWPLRKHIWWTQNRTQWWRMTGFPERYENLVGEMEEVHQRERTAGLPTSAARPTVPSPRTPRRCFLWPPPPPRTRPCVCNYPINSLWQSVLNFNQVGFLLDVPVREPPCAPWFGLGFEVSLRSHMPRRALRNMGPKGREMILWEHPFPSTTACFHSLRSAVV